MGGDIRSRSAAGGGGVIGLWRAAFPVQGGGLLAHVHERDGVHTDYIIFRSSPVS